MIYIIGAGYMAREYARVLNALNEKFLVIGRGEKSVEQIKAELDVQAVSGGLEKFIEGKGQIPDCAIVCTPVDSLTSATLELLTFGVKKILIEKPGALNLDGLLKIKETARRYEAQVVVGYNRRFYQSTLALKDRLKREQLIGANFEITEWSHVLNNETSPATVKQKWLLANTSHVIDLVLHITGKFKELASFTTGGLSWHESAARFAGSGISDGGVLISYFGYWDGPGRWSVEFVTNQNRYIFRPMEKLQVQRLGSLLVGFDELVDYTLDEEFKPGLYLQTQLFISNVYDDFCTIDEQIESFNLYNRMANYE